jgi:hypothetical protein
MDKTILIALLAVGAYYLLSGNLSSKPTFFNMSKQAISTIVCGNSIIFDVPGQSMIWLDGTKNDIQDTSGPYAVPAAPYILNCSSDVGTYVRTAYELNPDGTKGALLGTTTFTVTQSS